MTEEERREAQNSATQRYQKTSSAGVEEEGGNVLRAVLCLLPELHQHELRFVCEAASKMMTEQ